MFRYIAYFCFAFFILQSSFCFASLESYPWSRVDFDWQDVATLIVLTLTLFSIALEIRPPGVSMLLGALSLLILGILSVEEFLSGFSHELLLTIAMLFVISSAVEKSGMLNALAERVFLKPKKLRESLLQLLVPAGAVAAFFSSKSAVLSFTQAIRLLAKEKGFASSQFLLPLSYIASLGGMCSLVGTSANLVVEDLVRQASFQERLHFFELAYLGVPAFFLGLLYLLTVGIRLVPKREDPVSKAESELKSYTAEFTVKANSPLAKEMLKDAGRKYFPSAMVVQIERGSFVIDSPPGNMTIEEGDRLVFAAEKSRIEDLLRIEGLQREASNITWNFASSHFAGVVISSGSTLIGKTVREAHFRSFYGASCLAIYREGERVCKDVGEVVLFAGDVLILLSSDKWESQKANSREFYAIESNNALKPFDKVRGGGTLLIAAAFLCFAAAGFSLPLCALVAAACFVGFGFITLQEAQKTISWNLLLLISCSFAMAQAVVKTGIAASLASSMFPFIGTNPHFVVGSILLTTALGTGFFSNSAMAILLFPIAMNIAQLAGYEAATCAKAVGVAIALGCSSGFCVPTGYRTHLIVYSQGGYRVADFLRVGFFLDVLILLLAAVMIPWIWPLGGS